MTAEEIRTRILEVTARNGGHLASSLGAVEIAMALVDVFDPMRDRIVWDIGHQAYAWKLLTDRGGRSFDTLRQIDGVAPFPAPRESAADAAVAGHAGVALSVAAGLAAARDRRGTDESVVAVVGDGAMANGTTLEALHNLSSATCRLIVLLNDNGSVGQADSRGRFSADWFAHFGLRLVGPVDGHDLAALKKALAEAKAAGDRVVIRAVTKKGRGFAPAEADPAKYHGLPPEGASSEGLGWSECLGAALCDLAQGDSRIVALTAGMKEGTGLSEFAVRFPDRFHDVGIAEGHAVSFAAGLSSGGCRPFVAIYSTFLQRAVDQVMHDVCIASLPVVFCVDRAGVVGADGMTHQGVFDFAMLKALPNLTICQPKDAEDLKALLAEALRRDGPTVIRYPRGVAPSRVADVRAARRSDSMPDGRGACAIWATGDQLGKAHEVAARIPNAEVVFARYLKPFDADLLERQRKAGRLIVSLENGVKAGGFGETIGADVRFGWPDEFVPHGTVAELERRHGLDVEAIVSVVQSRIERERR